MSLLNRIGRCGWTQGCYKAAEQTERQLLNLSEKILGKEHTHTRWSQLKLDPLISNSAIVRHKSGTGT